MGIGLAEYSNMLFTDDGDHANIYVFLSDDDRQSYRYEDGGDMYFVLRGPLAKRVYLNERYANAPVAHVYAFEKNVYDVVLEESFLEEERERWKHRRQGF